MTRGKLALLCASTYSLTVATLFVATLMLTHGHFVYSLDDPYIHLALAEQLRHGHYGINPQETSSPCSSILWPLLLTPGVGTRLHPFLPLLWNVLCGIIAAALIGYSAAKWFEDRPIRSGKQWQQIVLALLLVFTANLASLSVIGMEHVLQVMLTICCAYGVLEAFSGRNIPVWCLCAAALAPAVRYEDLSITFAVCLALCGAKRWRAAFFTFGASLTPLLAFALFLNRQGLPGLPESVLVKSETVSQSSTVFSRVIGILSRNVTQDVREFGSRIPILALTILASYLALKMKDSMKRLILSLGALVGILQLTLGQFGWLHRYEVFAVIFIAMVVTRGALLFGRPIQAVTLLILLVSVSPYIKGTVAAPLSAKGIYLQQYQMHRFITEFYEGNVAVNDLGLTSYQRRSGTYILDLWGLGSPEAARNPDKSAPWLAATVKLHDVPLVMVYPEYFHEPASWVPIGQMCQKRLAGMTLASFCVDFYSTNASSAPTIRADFSRFAEDVPKAVQIKFF